MSKKSKDTNVLVQNKDHSIVAQSVGGYTGLWLTGKEGATIGLVLDEHSQSPYVVIWDTTKHSLPFAVSQEYLQLPRVNHDDPLRQISLEDLYNLVQDHKNGVSK